ncbi:MULTISPECIES: hypothetical protein [Bacillus]|uniref:hypothetical protein n=2 Tax=Bacillus TaxID=1386 RepID=UPI0012F7AD32|nr:MULTISPECIES: hypothetical protein [Bacillus]
MKNALFFLQNYRKGWHFSMYLSIRDEFHFFGESLHILQQLANKTGRYIKLRALSEVNNNPWTSAAEINLFGVTQ